MHLQTIIVDENYSGQRIDRVVAEIHPEISRSAIQALVRDELITVNAKAVKNSYRLTVGDILEMSFPDVEQSSLNPEEIELEVLYEDRDLAAINKRAGMVVHPAAGHTSGTLVNAILHRWPEIGQMVGGERIGIVHRLDKDTSGVILVAKNEAALGHLQQQFKKRSTEKTYIALVEGNPGSFRGMIDAPIGRDPRQRKKMAVIPDGKEAKTSYQVVESFNGYSLLHIDLHTGRTHQIRVHLAWLGYPVIGDRIYGSRRKKSSTVRLCLHAYRLSVNLPSTGERVTFTAPIPDELTELFDKLRCNAS